MVAASPRLIDRGELLATLDRAATGKVTLISAPAGSGKTSLLRAWADRPGQPQRHAIVQVQRGEQDAQVFWLALFNAVRDACGGASRTKPQAAVPGFNGPAMVDRVLSELANGCGPVVLIIDDLHELNSPEALAQLTRLLSNLPAHVHAILAARRDLRLHLHQLRLEGELAEIRAADLRFTERETRELFDASHIPLSERGASLLYQRTEGWATGLRLAAISMADHPDPERFVAEFSGSNRTVAEYLIEEMLERQPDNVQQLLLRTSLLDSVNGELADLLTGRSGSERILLELEDANALVASLNPERTWFRYHHLFGDLLRLELRRTLPEEVPTLHRRAAAWFTRHGRVVDAIRHTQAAGDWSDAAKLLADHSFSLTLDGQAQTIQALLAAFPGGAHADDPELSLVRASGDLLDGHLDEAAAHLAVAAAYANRAPGDRQHRLEVAIASLNLWLARRRGNLAAGIEQAKLLAFPVTGQSDQDIALGSDLRAVAMMNLGVLEAWSLGNEDGERHLQEGVVLARNIDRPYLEVGCLAQLGFALRIGSFVNARARCREAIELAERHSWSEEPVIAPALITLASLMIWAGEFDEGERWLQRAGRALQTDAGPGIKQLLHLTTGMLHAGRGRHHEALEDFSAALRLQSQLVGSHALATQVTGWALATQARLGALGEARTALATVTQEQARSGEIHNALAVLCLGEGNPSGALDALANVLDGTAQFFDQHTLVETHLLSAVAHHELGEARAAKEAAEAALAAAEPDGLVLPFAVTDAWQLLEALPRHETAHAALITAILDIVHGSPATTKDPPPLPQTEDLSPTELKVLRYLPTNLSRPEIATELSVSVNTVNTHIRNIYAKLQARDRSTAVQRARQLRLLSAGAIR